jgi:hypothetical protein
VRHCTGGAPASRGGCRTNPAPSVIVPGSRGAMDGCLRLAASSMSTVAARQRRSSARVLSGCGGRATNGARAPSQWSGVASPPAPQEAKGWVKRGAGLIGLPPATTSRQRGQSSDSLHPSRSRCCSRSWSRCSRSQSAASCRRIDRKPAPNQDPEVAREPPAASP